MSCSRLTKTNREPSILFDKLYQITGDEFLAEDLYNYFDSTEFKDIFGDYQALYNAPDPESDPMMKRLDENYEPRLEEKNGRFYFLDKTNEKVPYPFGKTGLHQYFTTNDIKSFAKTLALQFYRQNIEFNFDSLEFVNVTDTKLDEFIKEFIDKKINELMNSEDVNQTMRGIALTNSAKHIEEWKKYVKRFYSSIKVEFYDEEDTAEEIEEQTSESITRKESWLKSSKNNVNNNIKLFLSLLESDKLNNFNEYEFISFDDVYSNLNSNLKNITPGIVNGKLEDPYDLYLNKILLLGKKKSHFNILHDYLSSSHISELFKNQFVAAFNLYKNNFLTSEIAYRNGKIEYSVKNISDVTTRKNVLISNWREKFDLDKTSAQTVINENLEKIKKIKENFNNEETLEQDVNYLTDTLTKLGVSYTNEGITLFVNNLNFRDESTSKIKINVIEILQNINRGLANFKNTKQDIFKNQNLFKKLAEAESFFITEGSDAAVFTLGKSKWVYSKPSYLDIKLEEWKKDPKQLIKQFNATVYNRGSYYMEYFEQHPEEIENIAIGIFNSVQEEANSIDGVDNKDIAYIDSVIDHVHKILAFKKGDTTWAKTPLAADKNTQYEISFGNKLSISTNADMLDGKIRLSDEVLEIFYKYFKSEYERISQQHLYYDFNHNGVDIGLDIIKNYNDTLEGNAFKSQLFPELSDSSLIDLYDTDGIPIYEDLNEIKSELKAKIEEILGKRIENTLVTFTNYGILTEDIIDSTIYNSYKNDFAMVELAADFYINSTISQVEYSKMFAGDTAYYKDNFDYKKRVPSTYTDGTYLREDPDGNMFFNALVIEAVEIPVHSLEEMKKMLPEVIYKKYTKVNSTDGQAWITPQRWRFLMIGMGKWSPAREETYKKFFTPAPVFTDEELKFLAQPLKGVYYNLEDNHKPVYLKYSQAVLLPSLIKNTPLEDVYNMMKKNGIDEVLTADAVKVGSPIPLKTHDNQGNFIVNNLDETENNSLKLRNKYWKLQQELPTKGVKPTLVGSQIQKNIFGGLVHNLKSVFNIDNNEEDSFTGDELIDHLNDIYKNLSNQGRYEFDKKLGIENGTITDEGKLYSSLIQHMKARKDIPDNFIDALESGLSPLGVPGYNEIFQNVFSSLVNDLMVKIKTNGGGFIQMADYGITKTEALSLFGNDGIIFTPWFKDKSLAPPKIVGYTEEKTNIEITPENISSKGSDFAKQLTNVGNKVSITYKGKEYVNSEHAYQTWKSGEFNQRGYDLKGGKVRGGKIGDTLSIMTDILTEKLKQHPELVEGINDRGGLEYINKSTHNVTGDKFWESSGENNFINALYQAAVNVGIKNQGENKQGKPIIEPGGVFLSGSLIAKYVPDYREYTPEQLFGTYDEKTKKYKGGIIDSRILTNIIGYRIPNQALASNDALQVMGILPAEIGDTIIPYVGMTTKTGSDFDIDKMYLMIPSFKPSYQHAAKLRKHAFEALRGETIMDTVDNINYVIETIDPDDTAEFSPEELARIIHLKEDKDYLKYALDSFVNLVLSSGNNDFVNQIKEAIPDYNKITKLNYIKYDPSIPSHENSKEALQNRLISIYKSILTHPDTINDVMNPIDIEFIENDINDLNENDDNVNIFDSLADIKLRDKFKQGKAGLGQNVNSLVDAVRGAMATLYITDYYIGWGHKNKKANTVLDNEYSVALSKKDIKEYSKDLKVDAKTVEELSTVKISHSLMALVNGFVDVAKSTFLIDGNWNTQTNDTGFLLLRAGVHPLYVNAFIGQPILKEYVEFRDMIESKSLNDSGKPEIKFKLHKVKQLLSGNFNVQNISYSKQELLEKAFTIYDVMFLGSVNSKKYSANKVKFVNTIRKNLSKILNTQEIDEITGELLEAFEAVFEAPNVNILKMSLRDLRNQIKNESDLDTQLSIFNKFVDLKKPSKSVAKQIKASRVDVIGKGKNTTSLLIAKNLRQNIIADEKKEGNVAGFNTKLTRNGQATLLDTYFTNSIDYIDFIFRSNPKYFITGSPKAQDTFNMVSTFIYGTTLENDKLATKLDKAYHTYLLSGFHPFNLSSEERKELNTTLSSELAEYKKETDNLLLNELNIIDGKIVLANTKKSVSYINDLTDSWRDLFEQNNDLAEKLVKYAYITTGFNNNINQFHEYIPHEWFNKNRFNSYLKSLNIEELELSFIDQFFKNKYKDRAIAKEIYNSEVQELAPNRLSTGFTLKKKRVPSYLLFRKINHEDGSNSEIYYKFLGFNEKEKAVYVVTSVLDNNQYKMGDLRFTMNPLNPYGYDSNLYMKTITDTTIDLRLPSPVLVDETEEDPFDDQC